MSDAALLLAFTFVVHTLASARIARLIFKDTLFDAPREAIVEWLEDEVVERRHKDKAPTYRKRHPITFWVRSKIGYMITCPYCVSGWTTAGVVVAHRIWVEPLPYPVWWWLAAWMLAICTLEWTDSD